MHIIVLFLDSFFNHSFLNLANKSGMFGLPHGKMIYYEACSSKKVLHFAKICLGWLSEYEMLFLVVQWSK